MATLHLLIAVFTLFGACLGNTRLEFVLSGRDLPADADNCCSSGVYPIDGYAIVYYASSEFAGYVEWGRTSVLSDNVDPDWEEIFEFRVPEGSTGLIKIDIMDSDVDSDDYVGYAEMYLNEIISASGYLVEKQLIPSGNGRLRVAGRVNGSAMDDELFKYVEKPVSVKLARPTPRVKKLD